MLSVFNAAWGYADCNIRVLYAECFYAESRGAQLCSYLMPKPTCSQIVNVFELDRASKWSISCMWPSMHPKESPFVNVDKIFQ
jgi:hypothetical protein